MTDRMTPFERIETAIRLGEPDRVPVAPIIDLFSARYGGIKQHELFFDLDRADLALERTLSDLGDIDGQHLSYAGMGRVLHLIFPVPPRLPGVDGVPEDGHFQYVERSVMGPEEYREIGIRGPTRWLIDKLKMNHPEIRGVLGVPRGLGLIGTDYLRIRASMRRWRDRGVDSLMGPNITFIPFQWLSLALRSFNKFVLDLFRHPEDVKEGGRALMKVFIRQGMAQVMITGLKRLFVACDRASATFLSPAQFEEFALPQLEEMCHYFARKGITVVLHLDNDWTEFFPYFRELPRGKCIANLDGDSDIFKAKEVLGDHMCIMGDVPATLLKLGEPEEVDDYCRRLITEVGDGGGFILSSGCTMPVDAKPENVKAMLESVKRYRP